MNLIPPQSSEFDIGGLQGYYVRSYRKRRILMVLLASLLSTALGGAFVLLILRHASTDALSASLPVLLVLIVAVGLAWFATARAQVPAHRLVVSSESVATEGSTDEGKVALRWKDPTLKFRLYDLRGLPPLHRDGSPREPFVIELRSGYFIAVPEKAYREVLRTAALHRLEVETKTAEGRASKGLPGTYVITVVRGR